MNEKLFQKLQHRYEGAADYWQVLGMFRHLEKALDYDEEDDFEDDSKD